MKHRLVFYGTSPFAVPSLEALAADGRFEILAVVTQPDRPAGRKGELKKPEVKLAAEKLGLKVLQPESVKTDETFDELKRLDAEAAIVASYGQIIPQRVLDLYPKNMINVHASLLPEYRGSSPINAAIRDGREKTGVSIMLMDAKMDHGPVLKMAELAINPDDTTASLTPRLADLGAKILPDVLAAYLEGGIEAVEQKHDQATFVKILNREGGRLDPAKPAAELERLVRAMDPWPGTFIDHAGKRLKILKAKVGAVEGYPTIKTADGELSLITVQPDGKKAMDGAAFKRGHGF
jgi:methionyl-tRNA formyltransferase